MPVRVGAVRGDDGPELADHDEPEQHPERRPPADGLLDHPARVRGRHQRGAASTTSHHHRPRRPLLHRPLRADDARRGPARRHRRSTVPCSRCSRAARRRSATAWSPGLDRPLDARPRFRSTALTTVRADDARRLDDGTIDVRVRVRPPPAHAALARRATASVVPDDDVHAYRLREGLAVPLPGTRRSPTDGRRHVRRGGRARDAGAVVLNHDSAVAAAAARMVAAAGGGRCWSSAAAAPTRRRPSPPPAPPTWSASTAPRTSRTPLRGPDARDLRARLHAAARRRAGGLRAQVAALGPARPCWSTPTTPPRGSRRRSRSAGPELGGSASTPATSASRGHRARALLDAAGATDTRIVCPATSTSTGSPRSRTRRSTLRGRHLARHRLRRPDRRVRLQARRAGRTPGRAAGAGRQGRRRQGHRRRAEGAAGAGRRRRRAAEVLHPWGTPPPRRHRPLQVHVVVDGEVVHRPRPRRDPRAPPGSRRAAAEAASSTPARDGALDPPGSGRSADPTHDRPRPRRRTMTPAPTATYDPTTALVVVDVQNDFADPDGGLYVDRRRGGGPVVNAEIAAARRGRRDRWSTPRTGTRRPPRTSPRTAGSGRSTASATPGAPSCTPT
jgi:hypothetical protein